MCEVLLCPACIVALDAFGQKRDPRVCCRSHKEAFHDDLLNELPATLPIIVSFQVVLCPC